jgi:pimeloyl-ACP methyl ester carboxylesterase
MLASKDARRLASAWAATLFPAWRLSKPERIEAMVVVSATMYFPEQARAIMRQVPVENQSAVEWETIRKRHKLGDEQIVALWEWQRGMKDSYDDMNFTSPVLARITASTLIVYGDRDFLDPVEMAVEMYRAIPGSALWIVPHGGHGPVFLDAKPQFCSNRACLFPRIGTNPRAGVDRSCSLRTPIRWLIGKLNASILRYGETRIPGDLPQEFVRIREIS